MSTADMGTPPPSKPHEPARREILIKSTPSGLDTILADPAAAERVLANVNTVVTLRPANDADAGAFVERMGSINTKIQLRTETLADAQEFDPTKRSV